MSRQVNLLLLLSALLSALTGVGATARAPQAAQAVARQAGAAVAANVRAAPAFRPANLAPRLATIALAPVATALRLDAPVALFASRRRE